MAKERDDMFTADFPEDMGSGGGNRIPSGDHYIGKLVNITKQMSKNSGNPMWVWSFVITKGEYAGRDFTLYTALTPAAMWKANETLKAFGIEGEEGARVSFAKSDVVGVLVRLVIEDDEYNGREQSKLAGVLPHPNGAGYRSGAAPSAKPEDEDDDGEDADVQENEEEEEEEEAPRRSSAKKPVTAKKVLPVRGGRGKARL